MASLISLNLNGIDSLDESRLIDILGFCLSLPSSIWENGVLNGRTFDTRLRPEFAIFMEQVCNYTKCKDLVSLKNAKDSYTVLASRSDFKNPGFKDQTWVDLVSIVKSTFKVLDASPTDRALPLKRLARHVSQFYANGNNGYELSCIDSINKKIASK